MRGMKEPEMEKIALWINDVFEIVKGFDYSPDKEERKIIKKEFKEFLKDNSDLKNIKDEIKIFCEKFPIYK